MNIFNKYLIFEIFNHWEHETHRIGLISEIITQQPWWIRETPEARIFYFYRASLRRYSENSCRSRCQRFLSCGAPTHLRYAYNNHWCYLTYIHINMSPSYIAYLIYLLISIYIQDYLKELSAFNIINILLLY